MLSCAHFDHFQMIELLLKTLNHHKIKENFLIDYKTIDLTIASRLARKVDSVPELWTRFFRIKIFLRSFDCDVSVVISR